MYKKILGQMRSFFNWLRCGVWGGQNWVSELEHFGLGSLGIPIFGAKSRCCSGSMKFKDGRIMG